MTSNLTLAELEPHLVPWVPRLVILASTCLVFSLVFTCMIVYGSVVSFWGKKPTIVDLLIVFCSFGLVQFCIVSEICVLVRFLNTSTLSFDSVTFLCITMHFSLRLGVVLFDSGLTALTVMRYIYTFYPHVGIRITARTKSVSALCIFFLLVWGGIKGSIEYFYEDEDPLRVGREFPRLTNHAYYFNPNRIFIFIYTCLIYATDSYLTWQLWKHIHAKRNGVCILNPATLSKRQHQNLVTITGSFISRFFTLTPILVCYALWDYVGSTDQDLYRISMLFLNFICYAIGLPLTCFLHSSLLREPFVKLSKKVYRPLADSLSRVRTRKRSVNCVHPVEEHTVATKSNS